MINNLRLSFNNDEKNYDSIRPDYPEELFNDIFNYCHINTSSKCLEIGIGTGQATKPVITKGCSVTAIELGEKLSHFVADKYKDYNNFQVINDDFMNTQFSSAVFDLIYCATAFHWLPDEAYEKVRDLLAPNGTIALFWNHPYPNRENDKSNLINRKVYQKYRPSRDKLKEFSKADCDKIADKLKMYGFKDIECKLYHRVRTLSSDDYIRLLNTYSDHIAMPDDVKKAFENEMKSELDNIGGTINIYDTIDLYLAHRGC